MFYAHSPILICKTWFRQLSLEHLRWDFIRFAGVAGQCKTYLGQCAWTSRWVEHRQSGNPCWLGFVGWVCTNKWFCCWDLVATERRICGIRRDWKFKIGLIRSFKNLLKQKIRTLDWRWISAWKDTYMMVLMSIFSMSFLLYCTSGWRSSHTRRWISKEEKQHLGPLS